MPGRGITVVVGAMAALALLAACDKVGDIGNTCKGTGAVPIDATDGNAFVPPSVQIVPTQRVCWQNLGATTHTVTIRSSLGADSIDTVLPTHYTYTVAFGVAGNYNYHCRFHNETGVVQVR